MLQAIPAGRQAVSGAEKVVEVGQAAEPAIIDNIDDGAVGQGELFGGILQTGGIDDIAGGLFEIQADRASDVFRGTAGEPGELTGAADRLFRFLDVVTGADEPGGDVGRRAVSQAAMRGQDGEQIQEEPVDVKEGTGGARQGLDFDRQSIALGGGETMPGREGALAAPEVFLKT